MGSFEIRYQVYIQNEFTMWKTRVRIFQVRLDIKEGEIETFFDIEFRHVMCSLQQLTNSVGTEMVPQYNRVRISFEFQTYLKQRN